MKIVLEQQVNKAKINSITWSDASITALANKIIYKRPKCLILFTGGKVTRAALKKDRMLLYEHGIELIKANNFYLTTVLNTFFKQAGSFFTKYCSGYTLFAVSRRKKKYKHISVLFNLPYKAIVPTLAFKKCTIITQQRLKTLARIKALKQTLNVVGLNPFFVFILLLQQFIYIQIKYNKLYKIYN